MGRGGPLACVVLLLAVLLPTPSDAAPLGLWGHVVANDAERNDRFGAAVDVSGTWMAVGAPAAGAGGRIYLFEAEDGFWVQQSVLTISGSSNLGAVVSMDGDFIAASDPGRDQVHVWKRNGDLWRLDESFDGTSSFGDAIALSGTRLAVGTPGNNAFSPLSSAGHVQTFTRSASGWSPEQRISRGGDGAENRFGAAVALDAGHLVVGAPARFLEDEVFPGAAYIFSHQSGSWIEQVKLRAGSQYDDYGRFGELVGIDGQDAIVGGTPVLVDGIFYNGELFFYQQRGSQWVETHVRDNYGTSLDLQDGRAIVGEVSREVATVLIRAGTNWIVDARLDADDGPWTTNNNDFGGAVAIDSERIFVGAPLQETHVRDSGAVWTYLQNEAPVAVAGPDQFFEIKDPDARITVDVDGSASYDPDGAVRKHEWHHDGETVDAPKASFTLGIGIHDLILTVWDDHWFSDREVVRVVVREEPKIEPWFTFSPNNRDPGTTVRFQDASVDDRHTIISWQWDFDGDGRTDATGRSAEHVFATSGRHEVSLLVANHVGATATLERTVTVRDAPPVADAGPDQVAQPNPRTAHVVLDGSASRDAEGPIESYRWSRDGLPLGTQAQLEQDLPSGLHAFELRVTDNAGNVARDTVKVLVPTDGANRTSFNNPPQAAFHWSIEGPRTVLLTSSATDAESNIALWAWDIDGDGKTDADTKTATVTFPDYGRHKVRLTVWDMEGAEHDVEQTVTIGNKLPTAAFLPRNSSIEVGQPVVFLDQSTDPEHEIASWQWSFGDGKSSTHRDIGHVYWQPGNHTVQLTVFDAGGASAQATGTVHVRDAPKEVVEVVNETVGEQPEVAVIDDDTPPRVGPDGSILPGEKGSPFTISKDNRAALEMPAFNIWWLVALLAVLLVVVWASTRSSARRRRRRSGTTSGHGRAGARRSR